MVRALLPLLVLLSACTGPGEDTGAGARADDSGPLPDSASDTAADTASDTAVACDEVSGVGTAPFYADGDGDGFGAGEPVGAGCDAPAGTSFTAGDCDDGDAARSPGAAEVCNGVDDDCDIAIDDDVIDATIWYSDGDGDRYGHPHAARYACSAPGGYVADGTDCDDDDPGTNPGATERPDRRDNDCDGLVDEEP